MTLEGVSFNVPYWLNKSESEFISECLSSGLYRKFNEADRMQLLKIAYNLIQGVGTPGPLNISGNVTDAKETE